MLYLYFRVNFAHIGHARLQVLWHLLTGISQIARFMGPTWGPPGSCEPQMGPRVGPMNLAIGDGTATWPVTRSFDVFFDLRLNKRFSKQSWGWWLETLPHPLWHHSYVITLGVTSSENSHKMAFPFLCASHKHHVYRAASRLAPSHWETSLQT